MKQFFDFIAGGFFNYIGAIVRMPFSKEKFATLVEDNQSNNYGMLVMTIMLLALFVYIKYL